LQGAARLVVEVRVGWGEVRLTGAYAAGPGGGVHCCSRRAAGGSPGWLSKVR